jgi:hypothetical protein
MTPVDAGSAVPMIPLPWPGDWHLPSRQDVELFSLMSVGIVLSAPLGLVAMAAAIAGHRGLVAKGYRQGWSAAATLGTGMAGMMAVPSALIVIWHPSGSAAMPEWVAGLMMPSMVAGGLVAALACWRVSRRLPRRPRRGAGPRRRRFHYRRWAGVLAVAIVPGAVLVWWLDGVLRALQLTGSAIATVAVLRLYEHRYLAQSFAPDPADVPADVLYLRSFATDGTMTFRAGEAETSWASDATGRWVSLEQFLADEVERQLGRFAALGSPRDVLPPGGALRLYLSDRDWQQQVTRLATGARAVLMLPSSSAAVRWELGMIVANGIHQRLFVLTGPDRTGWRWTGLVWGLVDRFSGDRRPTWPEFAGCLRDAGLEPGEGEPGAGAVATFDADRRLEVLGRGLGRAADVVGCVAARVAATAEG